MSEDKHTVNLGPIAKYLEDPTIKDLMLPGQGVWIEFHEVPDDANASSTRATDEPLCSRYGDLMSPLDIGAISLLLSPDELNDKAVIRFLHLCDATSRAERISDPNSWSLEEREVYGSGDWQAFSRMRGYTEQEISEFGEFIALSNALDLKYGPDYACSLSHLVDVKTKKCL